MENSESFNGVMEKRLYQRAKQVLQEIKDAVDLQANQTQDQHADLETMNTEMEANLMWVREIPAWKSKNHMDAIPDKRR